MKIDEIRKMTLECLRESLEKQEIIEQLDVIKNLEDDPQVSKYISLLGDRLQNVPMEKKVEIIANMLASIGIDQDFDDIKNRLSSKFNQTQPQNPDEEIGDINAPIDVSPAR